jgi:hypothetical protein
LDYAGEAGANPALTVWEEIWAFVHRDALRFWAEMAPSPTRADSVRLIVTYAGYEGESELLWNLYEAGVKEARQLTNEEIPGFPDGPVPCWINPAKRIFAYWDSGISAQRMPWMLGERGRRYYIGEAATQTPDSFRRLHLNEWTSASSDFVPAAWWNACREDLPPLPEGDMTPLVVALDAAVTGDTFAMIVGCRHPKKPEDSVRVVMYQVWKPAKGSPIDFREPEKALRYLCEHFNIVEVAYDPYELRDWCSRLQAEGIAHFREFNQGQDRLEADYLLYQLICSRRIAHDGSPDLTEHIANCNAKIPVDQANRLRLVKRSANRHIDLAVATSMMCAEVLRLNLA